MKFLFHFCVMFYKNFLVALRAWKGTLAQIVAPVICILILYGFSNIDFFSYTSNPTPTTYPGLYSCINGAEDRCFTMLYTFNTTGDSWFTESEVDDIMQEVASSSGLSLNTNWEPNARDGNSVIYKVSSYDDMMQFILDHPNVTQTAVVFYPNFGVSYCESCGIPFPGNQFASLCPAMCDPNNVQNDGCDNSFQGDFPDYSCGTWGNKDDPAAAVQEFLNGANCTNTNAFKGWHKGERDRNPIRCGQYPNNFFRYPNLRNVDNQVFFGQNVTVPYLLLFNNTELQQTYNYDPKRVDESYKHTAAAHYQLQRAILNLQVGPSKLNFVGGLNEANQIGFRKYPEVNPEEDVDAVSTSGTIIFYCALMINFVLFVYNLVNEKALKLRQGMRMIGLSDSAYWMSWMAWNILFNLIYAVLILICGLISGLAFFTKTDSTILFLMFFCFGVSMTPFAIFISLFMTSTRHAITGGIIVFVFGTIFQIIFSNPELLQVLYNQGQDYLPLVMFWPPFQFSKIIIDIGRYSNETGANAFPEVNEFYGWGEFRATQRYYKSNGDLKYTVPSSENSLILMLVVGFIFSILSFFFFNVLKSEKGLPVYFFLMPSYWGFVSTDASDMPTPRPKDDDDSDVIEEARNLHHNPAELKLYDLQMHFTKGICGGHTIKAVKGVSLGISTGQVFALLGHNGAGKTTTINMLTGLYQPTSGDAMVFEYSLRKHIHQIRSIINVCPQHDILWRELTPWEHLRIFSTIKGVPLSEQKELFEERLNDVLLWDVRHKESGKFSGGMRRRLSVAISGIGDPKIIYLDEPTTGLDPLSRREVWAAINKLKKNRIVILTTHSMEEADVLGDRIGIMASGRLRCLGTSLHLKNKYGLGYRFNFSTDSARVQELKNIVSQHLASATLLQETAGSLIYGLEKNKLSECIPFFKLIEANRGNPEFPLSDWGMSQTTLEEVFFAVTKDKHEYAS